MNWITKALSFGKNKKVLKRTIKRGYCKFRLDKLLQGPILKKILRKIYGFAIHAENIIELIAYKDLILFWKSAYEILDTPIPAEDPLMVIPTIKTD